MFFSRSIIECPRSDYFAVNVGALYNKSEIVLFCFHPASKIIFLIFHRLYDSVMNIKQYAFANCSSWTTINILKCVENVESSIFFICDHLRCGVIIENRTISFIRKIISECLLNPKVIYPCDSHTCQCRIINTEITQSFLI
ncbi:hypothetical protein TVAG_152250 [Trichomonas vaginalis G3]|uniref:Uncharacterized protein n=1 Tax=Trichomonas vaginalis (strain ATCC PRA-98 / G3) TaxID=412133 RepID=A2F701_TRIV3|nr:regulation of response to stimulus [Trichomonas vaginalis G3]EAX99306.1 hypothetical protein TVAG_152250 [Trichomonas vaginalis G3]KAI5500134.1 regulation of response to stimulus [Trichomonas vaginalis G3]|eukprot:XP_001312236.1 hypothetical protein [Trichomonas vaginalis G3]